MQNILAQGGAIKAIESGYMKRALVAANTERLKAIERGDTKLVGVNIFTTTEASPLSAGDGEKFLTVSENIEFEQIEKLKAWRAARDRKAVTAALAALRDAAAGGGNIMEPSIACARAGVTTGEWAETLRQVFGEFRAPTGVLLVMDEQPGKSLARNPHPRAETGQAAWQDPETPHGQARPRRPFQRGRTDRRARRRLRT